MPEELTKEDWEYIAYQVQRAFIKARPKPTEGIPSPEFIAKERRIMNYLIRKAYT